MPVDPTYAAYGLEEEDVAETELGAQEIPLVHLGLTYDPAPQEEPLATVHAAAIPAWLVLLVGVYFAAKWAGERI